ncbi:substrate-binding domain-containing protein [Carboxylicivirga linearis]|uniref:Substrate-binding domain-containing protein n=1 Tax=Carboxylicivirga linearis TaxID=1628157 RepID=A0ABS5JRS6_9BACT|nr:substrate-binding domain-containing protein [Carboxylicivirga linearis]MBS2097579.1 substrate-binding domain-containing protein [Carboxylicivirga linearis]
MKRIGIILGWLVMVILITGCNQKPKIGFLMDDLNNERWKKDKELFVQKVEELGGIAVVEVANTDPQKQILQAQSLIDQDVDVLVVVPVDLLEAGEIVKLAHRNYVPVISYDRLIKDCNLDYYISTDNINIGELQANYLTKISPVGKYALISGPKSDYNAYLLRLGWMNILQPLIDKGDIEVVVDEFSNFWLPDEAYRIMTNYLKNTQDVDAIICGNDALASGAIIALKDIKKNGNVLIAGQDANIQAVRNIVAGDQTITIYKPIEALAFAAADAAIKIADGEAPSNMNITVNNGKRLVPAILLEASIVNRQNIKMTVISEGFMGESEIYN